MKAIGRAAAAILAAGILTFAALPTPASATTTTVPAQADAFVLSTKPSANKGATSPLRVLGSTKIAYFRFDVPAPPSGQAITRATLRVFAPTPARCTLGVDVFRAANDTWGETTIKWSDQPGPTGSVVANLGWTTRNAYREFNVTSAVPQGGLVSFLLRHASACNVTSDVSLNSREATSNQPQLVVETGPTTPAPACSDGLDNDGDGLTDHPADPGCTAPTDTDETDPPPGSEKLLAAAGDIACDPSSSGFGGSNPLECQHRATAPLLAGADVVLPLGDLQYTRGAFDAFMLSYDPSWGQYAANTYPVPGNHEYSSGVAQGYFDYWTSKGRPTGVAGTGYYSFELGSWHIIGLNSQCSVVPCAEGSVQNDFLEQDLASSPSSCILAYWHHPYFNSGAIHGSAAPSGARAFWDDLYAGGADIILNGHEHNYQRYAEQTSAGVATEAGIREFIVGTGGNSHYGLLDVKDANFEFGNTTDFGVLRLHLGATSYSWEFVGVNGAVLDSGGPVSCV